MNLHGTPYAKKRPKEADVLKAIMQYLKSKGIWFIRVNTTGIMRKGKWCPSPNITKGTSDLIAMMPESPSPYFYKGQLVAIEVKAPGGKVSPDQVKFLQSVLDYGGIALVVCCVGDVQDIFEPNR